MGRVGSSRLRSENVFTASPPACRTLSSMSHLQASRRLVVISTYIQRPACHHPCSNWSSLRSFLLRLNHNYDQATHFFIVGGLRSVFHVGHKHQAQPGDMTDGSAAWVIPRLPCCRPPICHLTQPSHIGALPAISQGVFRSTTTLFPSFKVFQSLPEVIRRTQNTTISSWNPSHAHRRAPIWRANPQSQGCRS